MTLDYYQKIWNAAISLCVLCGLIFYFVPSISVENLLEIELSDSLTEFSKLVEKLHFSQSNLLNNTFVDFFFIICYSFLFHSSSKIFLLSVQYPLDSRIHLLSLLPGLIDVIENIALLGLLSDSFYTKGNFEVFFWAVRLKWLTLIPFLLTTLVIAVYHFLFFFGKRYSRYLIRKERKKGKPSIL